VIPSLLILLPGYLEMHGNLLGSLAGRLSTALQLHKIPRRFSWNTFVHDNILATFVLGVIVAFVLGLLAYFLTWFIMGEATPAIIAIALIALIVSLLIEIPLTVAATYFSYHHGYDPDDVMGPYVTTLGDFIGILALLLTFWVVL
ncbi:MAG: magnesium transporter, partial [Nanoarchaeota archaeon]